MAGETQKTTALTNRDSETLRAARLVNGKTVTAMDTHQFPTTATLEAGDNLIMNIPIPSNAIIQEIAMYNDDLDTHACAPTLVIDIGVAAAKDYTDITSGTSTKHLKDAIIDSDLFVDGDTTGRAATTKWTALGLDSATFGPDDALKQVWELLGYDSDPKTVFNIVVQSQAASAALSAAGDMAIRVIYSVD